MSWGVNWKASVGLLGVGIKYLAVTLLVPLVVALVYGEDIWVFLVSMAIVAGLGFAVERVDPDPDLGPREALLFVSLAWIAAAVIGTIPYLIAGYGTASTIGLQTGSVGAFTESIANALFESMSGFTTTGATVLGEISTDRHSHAVLMWRQLTQWLGGMGIIVLMIAILPEVAVNGAQLMESEAPGPELQKLTPKIAETARALWLIYFGFTVVYIAILYGLHLAGMAPKMNLFNAIAHGFTTLPTGGFSPKADSVAAFSAVVQWVVIPFMLVAGVNFALFWHVLRGEVETMVKNAEFRAYAGAVAVVTAVLAVLLFRGAAPPIELGGATQGVAENSLRQAAFQIASLLNSTGYATADFAQWNADAQILLMFAMFIGGSAGSTGGGVKIVRWLIVGKAIRRELFTSAHPDVVRPVRLSGNVVDEDAIRGIMAFTILYLVLFGVSAVFLSLDASRIGVQLTMLESTSASLATIGNIGPGFGRLGPFGSYLFFPDTSKLLMIFLMWVGRLEIVPVLAVFISAVDGR
ncbi:trk system potassium uptake protein TrkH [Halorubrum ezzemoulense]|uniref:Trk system potassium uptake protein TrkH n=1 Tax=Halorubrum ezzemoulense TaxID=337243 RepID=A0A238UZ57_HALEZ|nr:MULTISPECIES: TrkH family potassium uptake protein [Halorubrum]MDB2242344.1 TrkH family potassium uptake protein [Halorubrum ezzemoulense]MDB9235185.1 TrkH family potassium uptake protein [Halorubrum ezzemoulense]TKX41877.1 TrkH family potassium uptake protein [Halorubrum sp. CGM4_25_10-8A]TKX66292.1 TrkH family potassium uptake protein [Halorubrum sp. GN12_10-3_MGM]SNR27475.1 trk system potassium uptake protein TrkH [Halorubrum ezzemoulense]